jgi:hypothetical protein
MSAIQEQLVVYLAPTATLYAMIAPQGTPLPYVTYQRITSNVNNVLSGPPSIENVRMQVDVWADVASGGYARAQALAQSIVTAMQAWPVQNVLLNSYDLYEQDVQVFRVLLEFSIWQ